MSTKLCKYCKTEIDKKAKICPSCQKKQSGKGKIIAICIVTLILIGAIFGNLDDNTTTDTHKAQNVATNDSTTPTSESSNEKEKVSTNNNYIYTIGDTATVKE